MKIVGLTNQQVLTSLEAFQLNLEKERLSEKDIMLVYLEASSAFQQQLGALTLVYGVKTAFSFK